MHKGEAGGAMTDIGRRDVMSWMGIGAMAPLLSACSGPGAASGGPLPRLNVFAYLPGASAK